MKNKILLALSTLFILLLLIGISLIIYRAVGKVEKTEYEPYYGYSWTYDVKPDIKFANIGAVLIALSFVSLMVKPLFSFIYERFLHNRRFIACNSFLRT